MNFERGFGHTMTQHIRGKKWIIILGVAVLLVLLLAFAFSGGNGKILKSLFTEDFTHEELRDQLEEFGWRGYIVIAVLASLQVVCSFLPAEPVQVLAGFTFGFPVGLLCCMAGVVLGSTMIFLLQKTFGDRLRGFFVKKLNLDLEKIARSSKAVIIIFILYFLPAIPYGMICFFAASMGMRYRRYITVMVLGALPSLCIGVSLGYMTIMSNWIVTVCVFAVLILLAVIVFLKKDVLFSRLNDYAAKNKKVPSGRVQDMNGALMTVVYAVIRVYFFVSGLRLKRVDKVGRPEKPSIVLCNHGSFFDFVFAAAMLRKYKPNLVSARLYFYHKWLGKLLRKLGAFPKSMFAPDMENARNCFTVLKTKNHLVMMPEARLSTTGRFEDIQENTYSFIKTAGVSVYTLKLDGSYLAMPKWGKGLRRGSVVEAELDLLYTAEQVQSISLEEMKQGIHDRLYFNDFQWLQQRPNIRYRSGRIAEGLENILMTCPICGKKHTITTEKTKVFCQHCGYLTSVDQRYGFDENFRFRNLTEWYDWQKEKLAEEIALNPEYALTDTVELRLPGDGKKGLTRHGGNGVCTLNYNGLTYAGTKDGETVELQFSLQRVYRLLFGAGQNFEIYDGPEILFFVPQDKRSAVDWYMTSMILHDETFGVQS